MNKQNQNTVKKDGFTIIEVVLVLAIAGLIFLMVFIALPNLQKGQRDSARKNDLARIATQIQNYQSSARGSIPSSSNLAEFTKKYLGGETATLNTGTCANQSYRDPSKSSGSCSGDKDGYEISSTPPTNITFANNGGVIYYSTNTVCSDDGLGTTTGGSTRNYSLRVALENQTAPYCVDNR